MTTLTPSELPKLHDCKFCNCPGSHCFQTKRERLGFTYWTTDCPGCTARGPEGKTFDEAFLNWNKSNASEATLSKLRAGTHVVVPNWAHIDTLPYDEVVWVVYDDEQVRTAFWYDEPKEDWLRSYSRTPFHEDEPPMFPIAWMRAIDLPKVPFTAAQEGE